MRQRYGQDDKNISGFEWARKYELKIAQVVLAEFLSGEGK